MKPVKTLSLILLAASLASGVAYAQRGGGMDTGSGLGNLSGHDRAGREPVRTQERTQTRTRSHGHTQVGDTYRHEYRHENRGPMQNPGTLPFMR
jgi:Ni/Co efflux regulator RcnB